MDLYVLEANLVYKREFQALPSEILSQNKQTKQRELCTLLRTQVISCSKVRALFDGKDPRVRTIDLGAQSSPQSRIRPQGIICVD